MSVELKELIIDELQTKDVFYTSTNKIQNYIRCPFLW